MPLKPPAAVPVFAACALSLLPALVSPAAGWAGWPVSTNPVPGGPLVSFEPYWDSRLADFSPEDVARCCDVYARIPYPGDLVIALPAGAEPPAPPLTVRVYPTYIDSGLVRLPSFEDVKLPRENPRLPVILPEGRFGRDETALLEYRIPAPVFPLRLPLRGAGGEFWSLGVFRYLVLDGKGEACARGTLPCGFSEAVESRRQGGGLLADSPRSLAGFVASAAFLFSSDRHSVTLSRKALDCGPSELAAAIRRLRLFNFRIEAGDEATASGLDALAPGWRTSSPLRLRRPGEAPRPEWGYERWSEHDLLVPLLSEIKTVPSRGRVAPFVACSVAVLVLYVAGFAWILVRAVRSRGTGGRGAVWRGIPAWSVLVSVAAVLLAPLVLDRRPRHLYVECRCGVAGQPEEIRCCDGWIRTFRAARARWKFPSDAFEEGPWDQAESPGALRVDLGEGTAVLQSADSDPRRRGAPERLTAYRIAPSSCPVSLSHDEEARALDPGRLFAPAEGDAGTNAAPRLRDEAARLARVWADADVSDGGDRGRARRVPRTVTAREDVGQVWVFARNEWHRLGAMKAGETRPLPEGKPTLSDEDRTVPVLRGVPVWAGFAEVRNAAAELLADLEDPTRGQLFQREKDKRVFAEGADDAIVVAVGESAGTFLEPLFPGRPAPRASKGKTVWITFVP